VDMKENNEIRTHIIIPSLKMKPSTWRTRSVEVMQSCKPSRLKIMFCLWFI
jgi:hypothetical protein